MATPWDDTLKTLVRTSPQAFVDWIAPGARFIEERNCELNKKLKADTILEVEVDGEAMIVHFEHIEVGELSPEEIIRTGQAGLLPLLPLTKGGATREVVTDMLDRLAPPEHQGLAVIGCGLAELIFMRTNPANVEWVKRRFRMLHDILSESSIFQEILQEGMEKGLEKGLEKGRLEALRESIVSFVHACYPKLEELASQQIALCEDVERLKQLRKDLYMARSSKKAKQYLLAMSKEHVGEA